MRRHNRPTRPVRPTTAFEYHSLYLEHTMPAEQRLELERYGWTLFSCLGPATPDDKQFAYHFRRPIVPYRLRVLPVPRERGR